MNHYPETHLHPLEKAGALESRFRLWLQNPGRILRNHIRTGMTVLDLGCGTGYFTIEIARLAGITGKVFACDVQNGMLELLRDKIKDSGLQQQIEVFNNGEDSLGLNVKVDFVVAFYSFHEMKYPDHIINDLNRIVKPETRILISEQKFHVSGTTFNAIIQKMESHGFEICGRLPVFLSRAVIMKPKHPITNRT